MTDAPKPNFSLNLVWQGEQVMQGISKGVAGEVAMTIDGNRVAGPSPIQAVGFALASCMALDLVEIIEKGRLPLKGLTCDLRAFRTEENPRRIIGVDLHFDITGAVPTDRIERAIELSREKYCSVWHSLDRSIDFKTTFAVHP